MIKISQQVFCFFLVNFLCVIVLTGCFRRLEVAEIKSCNVINIEAMPFADYLQFNDGYSRNSFNQAVAKSIRFLEKQNKDQEIMVCGRQYTKAWLLESLTSFQAILNTVPTKDLPQLLAKEFEVWQALNSDGGDQILVTGYYQPRLQGSLTRQPPFVYPLYRLPPDLISTKTYSTDGVQKSIGHLQEDRLVPYWTRAEIENGGVLKGNELLFLDDPVDAFILHVQGSGLVELTDGTVRLVQFAGSNGLPYRSIGKLLVDEGRIPLDEINLPKIRNYLNEHLDERQRILHYNERYIFFKLADAQASLDPAGSMGESLTPGRSVALDPACFPFGGLFFLSTDKPEMKNGKLNGWQPMNRFVLHQDSGAAIKGSGRLDFFWGRGKDAEIAAGAMKQPGRLFMLIKKEKSRRIVNSP